MGSPLEGIRILELSTMITGPYAGMMLADLGAEIIKLENPKGGDPFRNFLGGLYSAQFLSYNRNKRSITLDLRSDKGHELALKLVEQADVLLENFRPGVMDRLGLGYETLKERNPRLIYCSISGFGEDGPYRDRPAYDAVAQALSGSASLIVDSDEPRALGPTISDNMTGIYACYGIMGALLERERTGVARRVDVNMLESTVAFIATPYSHLTQHGIKSGPLTRVSVSQSYAVKCGDGKLLALHLSSPEKFWQGLLNALERPEIGEDERFDTRMNRIKHYVALNKVLSEAFSTRPREVWMKRLEEEDVPYAPILFLEEVFEDPQVKHLGTFFDIEHPVEGKVTGIRRPVLFDGSREDQPEVPPPTLGEQTDEILKELGYGDNAIADFHAESVV